jgi:poly-gamma-glutamate capsule biosynthesis protein CapA/YwtB (metallophosphatase superfamily)
MVGPSYSQRRELMPMGVAASIVCCGDLVLDEPDPDHWMAGLAPTLRDATLAIGHLEVPHTRHDSSLCSDVPAPGAPPNHLAALHRAGLAAVSLAGNHIADCGAAGIEDTIAELDRLGIRHSGAGENLVAAAAPAWLTAASLRIALLSYNCVGPEASWASAEHAGCAYVRILTSNGSPSAPAAPLCDPDPSSVALMQNDIRTARRNGADLCIVALHKGIVHTPALLAPYERGVAQAAIDAGADAIIGHHAHILRGIEFYRGRPIFHGLGNGCVVTRALSPEVAHPKRAEWARRRRALFGFEPDPAYHLAPFHPEAVHGMLARLLIEDGAIVAAGIIPVWFEPPGRPILADAERMKRVTAYVARITRQAGLPSLAFDPEPAMVTVTPRT